MILYLSPDVCVWDEFSALTGYEYSIEEINRDTDTYARVEIPNDIATLVGIIKKAEPILLAMDYGLYSSNEFYMLSGKFNPDIETLSLQKVDFQQAKPTVSVVGNLYTDTLVDNSCCGTLCSDSYVPRESYDAIKKQQQVDMHDKIEMGGRCLELEEKVKDLEAQLLEKDSKLAEVVEISTKAILDRDNALKTTLDAQKALEETKKKLNYYKDENEYLWQRIVSNDGYGPIGVECPDKEKKEDSKIKYITIKGVKYRV